MEAQNHPTSLGVWIRQRRRKIDMTQEALADAAALSVSAVRKIEADERHPSLAVADALARALQIEPAEQALFVRVARQEARIEDLGHIGAPIVRPAQGMLAHALPLPASGTNASSLTSLAEPAPGVSQSAVNGATTRPGTGDGARRTGALPAWPTPLVGREAEIAQIAATLRSPDCRLLTLTGAGGVGKTRLAAAAAESVAADFDGGVLFIALATVNAGEKPLEQSAPGQAPAGSQLAISIASALQIRALDLDELVGRIVDTLRERTLLLVLDSLEHLLEGGDGVVTAILAGAPRVKILTTSREELGLQQEWLLNVRGLPLPAADAPTLEASSALRLFVQSARRAVVGYTPDGDDLVAIAEICRLVDGLPLAIELAASWTRVLSPREIADEIARDWAFLSGATRDMPARHRSLRTVFDQTWSLLSPREQRIVRQLSICRGGFGRDAASEISGATLLDLATLTAKSLINALDERYEMHELIRQYAAERLEEAGEVNGARDRHAAWYRDYAVLTEERLHGPEQVRWLQRLDPDIQNFESALRWSTDPASAFPPGEGWRMISALWWFAFVRGYWNELYSWLLHFRELNPPVSLEVKAVALARTGNMAWLRGEGALAREFVDEALLVAEASDSDLARAMACYALGQVLTHASPADSGAAYEKCRMLARKIGNKWGEARSLYRMGTAAFVADDLSTALERFEEALALFRSLGDVWGITSALSDIAGIQRRQGKFEEAWRNTEESLPLCRALGFRQGIALELLNLGIMCWGAGEFAQAHSWLDDAERLFTDLDNKRGIADVIFHHGNTDLWAGNAALAIRHYEESLAMTRAMGFEPAIALALGGLTDALRTIGDLPRARAILVDALGVEIANLSLRFIFAAQLESGAQLALAEGAWESAACLFGAATEARLRYVAALVPVERPQHDAALASIAERIGTERRDQLMAQGAALDSHQARALLSEYLAR